MEAPEGADLAAAEALAVAEASAAEEEDSEDPDLAVPEVHEDPIFTPIGDGAVGASDPVITAEAAALADCWAC